MTDERFVSVGRVVKTHGLKGEVSAIPVAETSFESLHNATIWFVPPSRAVRSARITAVRPGPKGPLLTFDTITSIDDARDLVGKELLVLATELPADWAEPEDEEDFDGYRVIDVTHGDIGLIVETIVTGANDVWVIEGRLGEVLVPVIDDVVLEIDHEDRSIRVRLLDGLLPEDGDRP